MNAKKPFPAEDEELLKRAEESLNSDSPALWAQRELILEVFRLLLDQRQVKNRLRLELTPEQTTLLEGKLHDRIAAVIAHTYTELGDAATLADDEGLAMIRDLLLQHDPEIINRNRFRRIRRWN
jgi:hypothetical protein